VQPVLQFNQGQPQWQMQNYFLYDNSIFGRTPAHNVIAGNTIEGSVYAGEGICPSPGSGCGYYSFWKNLSTGDYSSGSAIIPEWMDFAQGGVLEVGWPNVHPNGDSDFTSCSDFPGDGTPGNNVTIFTNLSLHGPTISGSNSSLPINLTYQQYPNPHFGRLFDINNNELNCGFQVGSWGTWNPILWY
jgi:hypothetical protein